MRTEDVYYNIVNTIVSRVSHVQEIPVIPEASFNYLSGQPESLYRTYVYAVHFYGLNPYRYVPVRNWIASDRHLLKTSRIVRIRRVELIWIDKWSALDFVFGLPTVESGAEKGKGDLSNFRYSRFIRFSFQQYVRTGTCTSIIAIFPDSFTLFLT